MRKPLLQYFPLEAIIWTIGLIVLMVMDPSESHFSLCPIKNAGFDFCPGCGLGQSISLFVRGEFAKSFQAHPLGIVAFFVISGRIVQLIYKHNKRSYGKIN